MGSDVATSRDIVELAREGIDSRSVQKDPIEYRVEMLDFLNRTSRKGNDG